MSRRIVEKAIVISHTDLASTVLDDACMGGEIQPICHLTADGTTRHLIVIHNAASLALSWHPAYRWWRGDTYVPSEGTDTIFDRLSGT